MASYKPSEPPAGDFATFAKSLLDRVRKPDGSAYAVFGDGTLPKFTRWVGSIGEYDGVDKGGLRDVMKANAQYLDEVKDDLDQHRNIDNTRHSALAARVSALEAQGEPPFPIA